MTTGNSRPLALWTVINCTPPPSCSSTGASLVSVVSYSLSRYSTKARNEVAAPLGFEAARQVREAVDIGQNALAAFAEGEAGVRAGGFQQRVDGVRDGAVIAPAVQFAQQIEGLADGSEFDIDRSGSSIIGWKRPYSLLKCSSVSSSTAKRLPRSTAKTLSSSSGHSMARRAVRSVPTSSRRWKDFEPTRRCGMPRASRQRTYSCVRSVP